MKKNFIRIGNCYYACKCLYSKLVNGFYVPCGKCEFCRKSQARSWAFRLEAESVNQFVYNILLTYDDEHLYFKNGNPSLNKLHITEFMKRFRYYLTEEFSASVRFFLAAEYGGKFHRPHYHMILFSDKRLTVDDSVNGIFGKVHNLLAKSWKKGFVNIEYLNSASASVRYLTQYLCNYVTKEIEKLNVDKPFRMMTKGNRYVKGLGRCWIEDNKSLVNYMLRSNNYTYKINEKVSLPLPRYYKRIIIPEEYLIKMADEYYDICQSYKHYLQNLTDYEKFKFGLNTKYERRKQSEREYDEYYRKKVGKSERNASTIRRRSLKGI